MSGSACPRSLLSSIEYSILTLNLWIQEDERRKVQKDELAEQELPTLWILAATASTPLLEASGGRGKTDWMPGIYFLPEIFKAAIVVIDQLPQMEETLWLRVLGRDRTQEQAIREVLALPASHPRRYGILRLLASWKVRMDLGEIEDFSEQEAVMALSEAFLAWEQQTQERSKREARQETQQAIALNLIRENIPLETIAQATDLTIAQLQQLQAENS